MNEEVNELSGIQGQINSKIEARSVLEGDYAKKIAESLQLSNSFLDDLKTALGIQIRRRTGDSNLLAVNKSINQAIRDQVANLESIPAVQKQINKNQELIARGDRASAGIGGVLDGLQQEVKFNDQIQRTQREQAELVQQRIEKLNQTQAIYERLNRRLQEGYATDVDGTKITAERLRYFELTLEVQDKYVDRGFQSLTILQKQLVAAQLQNKELEKRNQILTDTQKKLEGTEVISDILSKIPGLSVISKNALGEIQKELVEIRSETGGIPEDFNVLTKYLKNVGKGIVTSFGKVAVAKVAIDKVIGGIKKVFDSFINTLKLVDDQTGKLAKNFNLTYQEALAIRKELVASSLAADELFVTSQGLQETLSTVNAAVGTRSFIGLNEQVQRSVVFLTKLREESGVAAENLQQVAQLTFVSGQNAEELTSNLLGAANVFAAREGVILNEKELFDGIKEASKATLLSLSQTPKEIGRAFVQARLLGASLSQIEGISGNLVNFESSITDELNAQVITGKALNLNAARFAALNNDAATVAKEIREQVGTAAEFAGMNRIEQEAIAKAVGVGRDDLAQMLLIQEQIAGLQGVEAERREAVVKKLIQQRGIEGAIQNAGQEQISNLEKQASVQEQFNASVNQLKEIFVDIATIIGPIFSGIASAIGSIAKLIRSVEGNSDILGGAGLGAMAGSVFGPLGTAIGGSVGALGGAVKYALTDDGYFPPMEGGEGGYDRTLLTPEGTFKFNNKDNILAGTDSSLKPTLPRRQSSSGITTTVASNYNQPITTTVASNYNQPINTTNVTSATKQQKIDMTEVISTIKKSNELIERQTKVLAEGQAQIRKQKTNLTVGATDLGTQISVNSSRVQYG